jgi:hypothetical protein
VNDIDREYARLQLEGVTITIPIETETWGERFFHSMFKFLVREYYLNDRIRVSSAATGKVNNEKQGFQAPVLKNLNIEFQVTDPNGVII